MMNRLALFLLVIVVVPSCKKTQDFPFPNVEIKVGYLSELTGAVHVEYYENQDTILINDLDTALAVDVTEFNLDTLYLDNSILDSLEFTIYVNTSQDLEVYITDINVYSFGRGGGSNNFNYASITCSLARIAPRSI